MTKTNFMEKYPVCTVEIQKSQTTFTNVTEIIEYLKSLVEAHEIAKFIATFNNYEHTNALGGEINPEIKDAQNLIFCFGAAIPNTKILAPRPRSFGIAELEDSFVVEFLEAPMQNLSDVMVKWAKSIANK